MKITIEQLETILAEKPVLANELEIKEVFSLLGFKLKEYHKAGLSAFQHYEVHLRRNYLMEVRVDDSRCLSISNEYVNFGDNLHGISFGGVDTVKALLQTVIMMAEKLDRSYDGTVSFNEYESEYTEDEFKTLLGFLNDKIFENAE